MAQYSKYDYERIGKMVDQDIPKVSVDFLEPTTEQAGRILNGILPEAIDLFIRKNADYNIEGIDIAATLGMRGQWSDMYRKIAKLKQEMWDQNGEGLAFENAEEVIQDLIGHCLLSLLFLKEERLMKDPAYLRKYNIDRAQNIISTTLIGTPEDEEDEEEYTPNYK